MGPSSIRLWRSTHRPHTILSPSVIFRPPRRKPPTFGDVFGGLQVKPTNPNGELLCAYSDLVIACDLLGGDQQEALRQVRARVCQYHDISVVQANTMPLSQFVGLMKAISSTGQAVAAPVDKNGPGDADATERSSTADGPGGTKQREQGRPRNVVGRRPTSTRRFGNTRRNEPVLMAISLMG